MESKSFLKRIIYNAVEYNASDLHIAPKNQELVCFKYRVNSILLENVLPDISFPDYRLLSNQIIIQVGGTGINAAITYGSFSLLDSGIDVLVKVSVIPTNFVFDDGKHCPMFVFKIRNNLDNESVSLLDLGVSEYHYSGLHALAKLNQGLILVTGPASSGKTTLLYALLAEISAAKPNCSIQTFEDPIERNINNVNQFEINLLSGIDYKAGLEALLHQDLDVALVGDIEDKVTAQKTTELAMAGHLVLSSTHSSNAVNAIYRLETLGVNIRDLADALKAIIATQLVRAICPDCAIDADLSDSCFAVYEKLIHKENNGKNKALKPLKNGCKRCNFTGYRGVILILEVLMIDSETRVMIAQGKTAVEIEQHLVKKGQRMLWRHGIEMLLQGRTSIAELERKLPFYDEKLFV